MTDVVDVKGVGPKTADKLKAGGFDTAEKLGKASVEEIVELGIGKATASKIIKNAAEVSAKAEEAPEAVEAKTSAEAKAPAKKAKEPKKKEEPPAEEKPKKKATKKKAEPAEEKPVEKEVKEEKPKTPAKKPKKQRLPPEEEVITTKKKKGVQVTKVDEDEVSKIERLDETEVASRETWSVTARRLSKEELEARKKRQQLRADADRITREIPTKPQPVKAKKTEKKEPPERPVKKVKESKEVSLVKKEKKKVGKFYSLRDLVEQERVIKPRGKSAASSESKPRSIVGKGTVIGHSTSFRRSRRVIHPETLIVQLNNDFDPEALLGKKVEIVYPDTNKKIKGSIAKRFGKRTSKKVLVRFDKGVRTAGLHQPVVIA